MSVDIRNTFEGRLNLVSMGVCRSVVGGPLEVVFFPSGRNGFPYVVSVYRVVSYFKMRACCAFASAWWRC